jgi:hypothetical protein
VCLCRFTMCGRGNDMSDSIEFQAQVARVQTMADGGLRFTLDTGEKYIMQAAQLMKCKQFGAVLEIKASVKQSGAVNAETMEAGRKRKSEWKTAEKSSADDNS